MKPRNSSAFHDRAMISRWTTPERDIAGRIEYLAYPSASNHHLHVFEYLPFSAHEIVMAAGPIPDWCPSVCTAACVPVACRFVNEDKGFWWVLADLIAELLSPGLASFDSFHGDLALMDSSFRVILHVDRSTYLLV